LDRKKEMLSLLPKICFYFRSPTDLTQISQWIENNNTLVLAGVSTFTYLIAIFLTKDDNEIKRTYKNNTPKKPSKSGHSEDQTESQANIETLFDYIVQENEGIPKDQRLADILSSPLPPSGFKEVFLSSDISRGSPGPFKITDLIQEVKNKSEATREAEMRLLQFSLEKNRLKEDINLLKSQLEAEEQLRIQAESKSSLMHRELEKLHKINSEHNIAREDLKQKIRQVRIEIELIDASRSDSDDSITKVQKVVAEIQSDHTRTKEEVLNLRETNKTLNQRNAHQRQKRNQLLKQRYNYQQQLSSLSPNNNNLEDPELAEYDYIDPEITFRSPLPGNMRSEGTLIIQSLIESDAVSDEKIYD